MLTECLIDHVLQGSLVLVEEARLEAPHCSGCKDACKHSLDEHVHDQPRLHPVPYGDTFKAAGRKFNTFVFGGGGPFTSV